MTHSEMTYEVIAQCNKMIAEYMGYRMENRRYRYENFKSSDESYWEWTTGDIVCDENGIGLCNGEFEPFFSLEDIPFDEEWDWLMPVVEKIELTHDVMIIKNTCLINKDKYDNFTAWTAYAGEPNPSENKIEAVWYAVVKFIEWYNQNK